MGVLRVDVRFSLSRRQFIRLLLLNGSVKTKTDEGRPIAINGAQNHQKYGLPGKEDRSNHFFNTYVTFDGQEVQARASLNSSDNGKTYQGALSFNIWPNFSSKLGGNDGIHK